MKAILSNRIYLPFSRELLESLKKELTYPIEEKKPRIGGGMTTKIELIKNYKVVLNKAISIPSGRLDLIPEGFELVDKTISEEYPFPEPKIALRQDQKIIYDQSDSSLFLNAKVGWGKTFTALHIVKKLSKKTLVITHNTFLRDQWLEEAGKLFEMPLGIIGSNKFDIDHSLVIGNVQSVAKRVPDIAKEFGTVVMDEAHHTPASTFTNIIDSMHAKYKLGLSGTMIRNDGRHVLFKDFFGPKVLQPPKFNTIDPIVRILKANVGLPPGNSWAEKINALLYDPEYQHFIAKIAKHKIAQGHSVLIAADRTEFLRSIKELIGDDCLLVIGETTFQERKDVEGQINSGQKACIAGSRSIFTEGISINRLSCLILAGPIANEVSLEQLCGRVTRQFPNKKQPEIIDINLASPSDRKHNNLRLGFYLNQGWEVTST